jgi:gamma-glutamyltranspeptidase/glutathione hydrolase
MEVGRFVKLLTGIALSSVPVIPAFAGERGAGVVVADHPLASRCGASILDRGGNAADAVVAAALCAGVVQPSGSGLGGGGFAVVVDALSPRGDVVDFREVAPAAASRDMYLAPDGSVRPGASVKGGLSVAVPSESRGLAALLAEHGSLPPRVVAAPAVALAARGFHTGLGLAAAVAKSGGSSEVARTYVVDGHPARTGDVFRNPALAATLRRWAATAGEDLHVGTGAAAVAEHVAEAGGIVTLDDLRAVTPKGREPVVVRFGERTVITMPPPSSGGVALAEVLRALDGVDLAALGWNSSDYLHRLVEAMKHAYADRARFLGDPDFVDVPVAALVSDARAEAVRAAFDPDRTLDPDAYGAPAAIAEDHGTQHISALDGRGGAVALTTTVNTRFGSELIPPSLGLVLNDQMDDFSAAPGVPNAYGLIGGEANAIAPGKRPLSSMTPTVVLGPDGRVELVIGASGGSRIISATLQALLAILVFDVDPATAVAAPRVHHQWQPDRLEVEPTLPEDVRRALEAKGHTVVVAPSVASVQAIRVFADRTAEGGADPRHEGRPAESWTR